jgi:hypothetical protein
MAAVLRDKADNLRGFSKKETESRQVTTYQHIIQIDSRDCVGTESLACAKKAFEANGGRKEASGLILGTTGIGISPIKIGTTTSSVSDNQLKNGDLVIITGVQGNTVVNNTSKINNLTIPDLSLPYLGSSFEIVGIGNGNYAGGGTWTRIADVGYPVITTNTNLIIGNEMIIALQKRLKAIRSIALNVSIIPRDIIPICSYYKDLYYASSTSYITYIPQEPKFMKMNSYGFYSTDLSIFRTYNGAFSLPNQVTPPPLNLWNPPVGLWPNQPIPYPFQTVPTYRSDAIVISGLNYYLICSGYGVYDLNDWTSTTQTDTEIARKALLRAIIRPQMSNGINYTEMIINCATTSNAIPPFGYGQFQRFLCGPGLQLNYQPGTSDGANPSVAGFDWPIAFPNFKGNVWGPYDTPGDRFQKLGLRDIVQDLFLNGDLDNLFGSPIIKPDIKITDIINDPDYGINIKKCIESVNFTNASQATNFNISNAMRLVQNGFGAAVVTAQGLGNPLYTTAYQASGGIGPSSLGAPSAWSLTGVYGVPNLNDPNAVGPLSWNLLTNGTIPQTGVGNLPPAYPAQTANISHRIGWYDLGPSQGAFKSQIKSYMLYAIANLPATNLVIQAFQFPRDERVQSTNSEIGSSILNIPIRLLPDISSDGGFQYIEGLLPLLTQASDLEYWGKRFLTPMASLDKISLKFYTYDGIPIPLERQLSYKNMCSCPLLSSNALLRSRREISLLLRAECYQYVNAGLDIIEMIDKILGIDDTTADDNDSYVIRASNYQDYT